MLTLLHTALGEVTTRGREEGTAGEAFGGLGATCLAAFTLAMSMALFYRRRSSAANAQLSGNSNKSSRRGSKLPSISDDNLPEKLCE